ncbi:MAG TPA: S26 family signal peptidase [Gemmataceae bacterium]|nr:S26 family signal peptidase [Gemmataceae bacterium]
MQCSSCHFENMPGVEVCGRCGSSLRLATAVVDVHPPRARPWVKRMRRTLPLRKVSAQVRDAVRGLRHQAADFAQFVGFPQPRPGMLPRLIVPGWAHIHSGQVLHGSLFLGVYLTLLAFGFLCLGTQLGSFLLGLAFSVHLSSVLSILFACPGDIPSRFVTTTVVAMTLSLAVYFPAGWLLTRVADPHTITLAVFPFEEGDVVLANQWAYLRSPPQPGDIVLYERRGVNIPPRRGHVAIRLQNGQDIDRILAGPGSQVRWENGELYVDGRPSPFHPLNPLHVPTQIRLSVPEGHYCILPSTLSQTIPTGYELPASVWGDLSIVRAGRIQGRVYWRHQPLSRMGLLR